jgi:hypothetical protein
VLEDMLRMHVMHHPKKWEDYLPLVEFSYNNGYQESLKMSPFEALYGRQCKIPISWDNPVDRITIGPDMLKEMEQQVVQIKQNLKATKYHSSPSMIVKFQSERDKMEKRKLTYIKQDFIKYDTSKPE